MAVEQVVDLKVVVVLPERVVEGFCHAQPAKVEEKLDRHEDWVVDVKLQKTWNEHKSTLLQNGEKKRIYV